MSELRLQAEATTPTVRAEGRTVYHGYEVFETRGGGFELVIHARSYDGLKVVSRWDSGRLPMEAGTVETAKEEATRRTIAFVRATIGASSG